MNKNNYQLGEIVKGLRLKHDQTLEELSQSLSVHKTYLSKIEKGVRRPSIDLLLRLSSIYSLSADEQQEIIHIAGYNNKTSDYEIKNNLESTTSKGEEVKIMEEKQPQIQNTTGVHIKVPEGLPVLYSDTAFITAGPFGLVFDFGQVLGPTSNHNIVSRVGMSIPHAKALIKLLSKKIVEAESLQVRKEKEVNNNS